jgi:hypothetical protein
MSRPHRLPHETDDRPILSCWEETRWFQIFQRVPPEDYPDKETVKYLKKAPIRVSLNTASGLMQYATVAFATRPQDAPILHFCGPLRLEMDDIAGPFTLRRGESSELYVRLTTPGLNARVTTDHYEVPGEAVYPAKEAHPVAQFEFPPGRPGREPIRLRVELQGRC